MRVSTAGMHAMAVRAMLRQQSELANTQQQIATGKRVRTAADDPVAAVQLQELARLQSQHEQFDKNSIAAADRLQLEEQSLVDATSLLQRVRDLALQANSAALTETDRQYIVTEIRSRLSELQGIANRRDTNGDYLFAGYSAKSQPFLRSSTGAVQYAGDIGTRDVQIDAAVAVRDADNGQHVFVDIPAGNGTFTTAAAAGNTGSGVIDTGTVMQPASWVPDQYQLTFTSAAAWQVTDSASTVVAAGTYTSGSAIAFRGVQVMVTGAVASGDSFAINQAGTQDVFGAMDALITAVSMSVNGDAARARSATALGGSLQQIDQTLDHLLGVRAEVGARLSLLDDVQSTRDSRLTDIATSISQLRDLDYAAAVSKMNQQYVGLQAAQQSYSAIARLSLFDYL
jgi:flagellar hook-associated protein 3 FlgL